MQILYPPLFLLQDLGQLLRHRPRLFVSQPAFPASSTPIDFFAAPVPVVQAETKSPNSEQIHTNTVDPFASVPLNNFDGSDLFSAFTSHADTNSQGSTQSYGTDANLNNYNGKSTLVTETPPKMGSFQVKSGVWADSLSRGLIDLNISAPKKVSLVDIGVVGGLSDGSEERDMIGLPTSFYMGKAMGTGSGLDTSSGYTYSTATNGNNNFFSTPNSQRNAMGGGGSGGGDDFFSSLGNGSKDYQYGSLKK